MKNNRNYWWLAGLIAAVAAFALLLGGILGVLGQRLEPGNYLALGLLAIAFGGLTALFYSFKRKIGFWVFVAGSVAGFVQMYITFIKGMDGWGDLIGVLSLLMLAGIGALVAGGAQLTAYLIDRYKAAAEG